MGVIKTNFLGNDMPKENNYTCITCITIDSVLKIDKKSSTSLFRTMQIQGKKTQMSRFINTELKSDPESSGSDLD